MKIDLAKLKEITLGTVNVIEENGLFHFKRFTEEQENFYKETNDDFYNKTYSTAGVKFSFKTNSKNLFIKVKTEASTPREYFSIDIFVNGEILGYLDNFSDVELEDNYTVQSFPHGQFSKNFELGDGEKEVCVHLPWSVKTYLEEFSVDDNAFISGIKPLKKILMMGDSITHGYDSLRPSGRYSAILSSLLEGEEINKGIGGEIFSPEFLEFKEDFVPHYITVAYGTNDYWILDKETFKNNCYAFYRKLAENYPCSKIFAITPLWRRDLSEKKQFGKFEEVEPLIREAVSEFDNIKVISGYNLVLHDDRYFADNVHPNAEGFKIYAKNLFGEMQRIGL